MTKKWVFLPPIGILQNSNSRFLCEYEKINAIYGSTGLWNQLRYWWLDTENYTSFMLMDKGFYDYDYSEPKGGVAKGRNITKATDPEKLKAKLARLGITQQPSAPLAPAELQAEVMREEEKKQEN